MYIKGNWIKTFHPASELAGDVKIDHPYVSPCATDYYTEMFYWDTYFINIGLILDGYTEQARNNIDNISKFINALGFMPNAHYILDRSQPPFFTRMVHDYYERTGDKSVIEDYIGTILKEYDFWQTKRKNAIGLNSYGAHGSDAEIMQNYNWHHGRVFENEDFRARFLEYSVEEFDKTAIAVFIADDKKGFCRVENYVDGVNEYHNIYLRVSPANTDILNPAVTDAFIKETHEKYYARFKEYFGKELIGYIRSIITPLLVRIILLIGRFGRENRL